MPRARIAGSIGWAMDDHGEKSPISAAICTFQNMGARLFVKAGTQPQRSYLPRMAKGETLFGFALNEAESLNLVDVPLVGTTEGQTYILNGAHCFIANGDVADIVTVFLRVGGAVSAVLVKKGTPGFSVARTEGLTGSEARYSCKAVFQDCRVPLENLLGQEGEGLRIMGDFVGEMSCATAARAVGLAHGALEFAIEYAKNRVQFGSPIIQFQAIQSLLAGMVTKVEAARHLLYRAASMFDQGGKDVNKFSAMAKYFASEAAMSVTTDAVQIAGGYGYIKDYPLEKMMRNAKLTQISEGTNQIQQLIIAKATTVQMLRK